MDKQDLESLGTTSQRKAGKMMTGVDVATGSKQAPNRLSSLMQQWKRPNTLRGYTQKPRKGSEVHWVNYFGQMILFQASWPFTTYKAVMNDLPEHRIIED